MTARLLRWVLFFLACVSAAWLAFWAHHDRPRLAMFGACVLLSTHAWVLAIEFACSWFVNAVDATPRATLLQVTNAWWREVVTDVVVFAWQQAFRSSRIPDQCQGAGRRGMVFVHGFFCNRGVFNPWLQALTSRGIPFIAINLSELFGSIDDCTPHVNNAVERMFEVTGKAPIIVAHSMGGLVVRAWLNAYSSDQRVHRIITIGTPHEGTWLARFGIALNATQMRRSGKWLQNLRQREPKFRATRFVCYYSNCDNVVFPASTATLPGADNRHLAGQPHVAMVYEVSVLAEAIRLLDAPPLAAESEAVGPAATTR